MGFLKFGDVFITSESNSCLTIKTSEACYQIVRNILIALKDSTGLPVSLHGEIVARTLIGMRIENGGSYEEATKELLTSYDLPRNENSFIIPAWQMGVRGEENTKALAEELQQYLSGKELEVVVNI